MPSLCRTKQNYFLDCNERINMQYLIFALVAITCGRIIGNRIKIKMKIKIMHERS
jgi:hypothetical protein